MHTTNRIEWIDYAKAIGIWLVIMGHILNVSRPIEGGLYTVIYSFHMPFFFFVSGLLFSTKKMPFGSFAISKVKSLLVPYLLLNILCAVLCIPMYLCNAFPIADLHAPILDLLTLFDGNMGSKYAPPSWFLISLFIVMMIRFFAEKCALHWRLLIMGIAIAMTYVLSMYKLPLSVDKIPGAYVFFSIGCLLHGKLRNIELSTARLALLALLLIALHIPLALYNGPVHINEILGHTGWLFWIVAVLGIAALVMTSELLSRLVNSAYIHTYIHTARRTMHIIGNYDYIMFARSAVELYDGLFPCQSLVPYPDDYARIYVRNSHITAVYTDNKDNRTIHPYLKWL